MVHLVHFHGKRDKWHLHNEAAILLASEWLHHSDHVYGRAMELLTFM